MEEPSKGFRRLSPGSRVRLRHAHVIECQEVIKDSSGQVIELRCVYLPETLGRDPLEGPKPKSVIHWVSAEDAKPAYFACMTVFLRSQSRTNMRKANNLSGLSQSAISDGVSRLCRVECAERFARNPLPI